MKNTNKKERNRKPKTGSREWYREMMNHCYGVMPWVMIENVLGKAEAKKFGTWMRGQTQSIYGVYPHDLKTYLQGKANGAKKPHIWD